MIRQLFLSVIGTLILISAAAQQDELSRKELKEQQRKEAFDEVKALVDSMHFDFTALKAFPMGGTMIDLTTNQGDFIVEGDMAEARLPFFGRSYSADYGGDAGLKFKGKIEKETLKINEEKMRITLELSVRSESDNRVYICTLQISSKDNTSLIVTSPHKSSINYSGRIDILKKESE